MRVAANCSTTQRPIGDGGNAKTVPMNPTSLPKHYVAIAWANQSGYLCGCGQEFKTWAKYEEHLTPSTLFG
jgi:hypothetical protein